MKRSNRENEIFTSYLLSLLIVCMGASMLLNFYHGHPTSSLRKHDQLQIQLDDFLYHAKELAAKKRRLRKQKAQQHEKLDKPQHQEPPPERKAEQSIAIKADCTVDNVPVNTFIDSLPSSKQSLVSYDNVTGILKCDSDSPKARYCDNCPCLAATIDGCQKVECGGGESNWFSCRDAAITNCQEVSCSGVASCFFATMTQVNTVKCTGYLSGERSTIEAEHVYCLGAWGCFGNTITAAQIYCGLEDLSCWHTQMVDLPAGARVVCQGKPDMYYGPCAGINVSSNHPINVTCSGYQACVRQYLDDEMTVTAPEGTVLCERGDACSGMILNVKHLFCQGNACDMDSIQLEGGPRFQWGLQQLGRYLEKYLP